MARVNTLGRLDMGMAPRPPREAPPSIPEPLARRKPRNRSSLLCATLLPVFVGVLAIAALQFVAHQEVLRRTYAQVLDEVTENAALHLDQHFDDAVLCTRAASANFVSRPAWVGTPAADSVLLGLLRTFPKVASVLVSSGSGLMSGAGRMPVRRVPLAGFTPCTGRNRLTRSLCAEWHRVCDVGSGGGSPAASMVCQRRHALGRHGPQLDV